MMNQFVQLNSLSELKSITSAISEVVESNQTGYAAGLIGKTVQGTTDGGKVVTGVVDSITMSGGAVLVNIGSTTIPLANVTAIAGE